MYIYDLEHFTSPLRSSMFSSTMLWWRTSWAERQRCPPHSCTVMSTASSRPVRQAAHSWKSSSGWVNPLGVWQVPLGELSTSAVCTGSWNCDGPWIRSLLATCSVTFQFQAGMSLRTSLMFAWIKSRHHQCFIKLLNWREKPIACTHWHFLLSNHMLTINARGLL